MTLCCEIRLFNSFTTSVTKLRDAGLWSPTLSVTQFYNICNKALWCWAVKSDLDLFVTVFNGTGIWNQDLCLTVLCGSGLWNHIYIHLFVTVIVLYVMLTPWPMAHGEVRFTPVCPWLDGKVLGCGYLIKLINTLLTLNALNPYSWLQPQRHFYS